MVLSERESICSMKMGFLLNLLVSRRTSNEVSFRKLRVNSSWERGREMTQRTTVTPGIKKFEKSNYE